MEIPYARWYPQIAQRHSRRQYDISRPIPSEVLDTLRRVCADFKPFKGARVELITDGPEKVFKGMLGSYGKVKGAGVYLAFIGNMSNPHAQEMVGYTGEGLILEASASGLGTCWVAGAFRPESVAGSISIEKDEKVLAVSPVGYAGKSKTLEERLMSGFIKSNQRRPLGDLVTGEEETRWPSWLKIALEAARLAP
ncbi:MAG TPA: nitroreductase family protein, partial [Dehalococcoidales bacterium]